nr:hypothetical protein [Angustibacter aerolatus]
MHLTRWAGAGGAPPFAGIGYGTTAAQARVGALGETVERAASWRSTLSARPRVATRGEPAGGRGAGARPARAWASTPGTWSTTRPAPGCPRGGCATTSRCGCPSSTW